MLKTIMYKLILTSVALFTAAIVYSQTIQTKYFKDKYLSKETTQEKAKFSQAIIKNPDGSLTAEVKDIKENDVISIESFKGNEPTGIWRYKGRNIPEPLDFSFDLVYSDGHCTDSIAGVRDYFENNDSLNYIAPKISTGQTIWQFNAKNLRYPSAAIENGIEGRVFVRCTITKEGKIENVVVRKGAHTILDKEAARVIRKLTFSNPPSLNGQPKDICLVIPVQFRLE